MMFGKTVRVTLRVGQTTLERWKEAAKTDLAWSLHDWIAALCNGRASDVAGELSKLRAEVAQLRGELGRKAKPAKVAGPVGIRGKAGRR